MPLPHRTLTTIPIIITLQRYKTLTLFDANQLYIIAHLFFSTAHNCSAAGANTVLGITSAIFLLLVYVCVVLQLGPVPVLLWVRVSGCGGSLSQRCKANGLLAIPWALCNRWVRRKLLVVWYNFVLDGNPTMGNTGFGLQNRQIMFLFALGVRVRGSGGSVSEI